MDREVILYKYFVDIVLEKMNHDEMVTRSQIMYSLGLNDYLTDKLLWYIKRNCTTGNFNEDSINESDGYMIQFMKPNKITKMYIKKL